jgi:hypothetical protein
MTFAPTPQTALLPGCPKGPLRVLSLGAGVQSTTLALMAAHGVIEPPDCAIFADTGWEPGYVYEHLNWLEAQLPFPVHRVQRANIRTEVLAHVRAGVARTGKQHPQMPVWTATRDGQSTPVFRTCTHRYKVEPIIAKTAELAGIQQGRQAPKTPIVETWIGISTDEASRMKPSDKRWIKHRWPLIEAGMNRAACLAWFEKRYPGRTLGKSSCVGCPYHSNAAWREIKDTQEAAWAEACELDEAIRNGLPGMTGTAYLHRSLVPLRDADLRNWDERGQPDLFNMECEGMCGV